MIIPIGDINPRSRFPWVNYGLIGCNLAAFILLFPRQDYEEIVTAYGLVPGRREIMDYLTSLFLHANIPHLIGNLLFLWIAGDNVEDGLGRAGYLVFYLASGVAAGVGHTLVEPGSEIPCIGASGAISGVMGAYVVMFPRSRILFFYWFYFFMGTFTLASVIAIGFWFLEQLLMAQAEFGGPGTNVAYVAHVAGFAVGAAAALALRLSGVVRVRRRAE